MANYFLQTKKTFKSISLKQLSVGITQDQELQCSETLNFQVVIQNQPLLPYG